MKKHNVSLFLLPLLLLLFSSSASALPPAAGGSLGPAAGRPLVREIMQTFLELNLSKEQRVQIKSIIGAHQDEILNDASMVLAARLSLFDAIHQDAYDEDAVTKAARDTGAAEEQLAVLRAKVVHEVRAVLTDQQKALLASKRTNLTDRIRQLAEFVKERFVNWVSSPPA